jgi:Uma2 family endonuclease
MTKRPIRSKVLPMSTAEDRSRISPQEYYRLEAEASEKSDWFNGEMFNMAGGTTNHSRIKVNLSRTLGNKLAGSPCEPLDSDQRLVIRETGLRTYPDLSVYCGPIEYDPEDATAQTATNPTALFEVLSDSTEAYDRGLKADSFRRIPGLRSYAFLSQHTPHIELYERQDDGSWRYTEERGIEAEIGISCLGVILPLREVYERVEFQAPLNPGS